jgi:2,4-dienoyl-CoA reductase-like NADH-dependent reductase (Old Yellow Enzyme family)
MMGDSQDGRINQSTIEREAYFLEFAKDIAAAATIPLMVTGGITKRNTADEVINTKGIDLVGIARGLITTPDLPHRWKSDDNVRGLVQTVSWKNPGLRGLANMALAKANLRRMSQGQKPKPKLNPILASLVQQKNQAQQTKRYKAWLEQQKNNA